MQRINLKLLFHLLAIFIVDPLFSIILRVFNNCLHLNIFVLCIFSHQSFSNSNLPTGYKTPPPYLFIVNQNNRVLTSIWIFICINISNFIQHLKYIYFFHFQKIKAQINNSIYVSETNGGYLFSTHWKLLWQNSLYTLVFFSSAKFINPAYLFSLNLLNKFAVQTENICGTLELYGLSNKFMNTYYIFAGYNILVVIFAAVS